ncbi:Cys-tRNA(Pro) deacylase [Ammoniphilus sp. 3BR4]|uniref:Cys-tRNA(Pro) deacylase n=1 Tax=Ammoniphilus sp. 3BR4 TaxID=3158265 RepID=UPI0034650078
MAKVAKTNAMRILDQKKLSYLVLTYDSQDGKIDGLSVAEKIGKDPANVYKTLVAQGAGQSVYVFVVPVGAELDLKKAAKASSEKKLEMLPVKDIQKWTGYIRGGCSPVGMKKLFPTYIDESASKLETIIVSGGKIGIQLQMSPKDLAGVTEAKFLDIIK